MNIISGNSNSTDDNSRENLVLERHKHTELDLENQLSSTRTNCEQITLIWLDSYVTDNGYFADDIRLTKEILRELNDYVTLFDNESECLTYISSIKNEIVLLIVSGLCATSNLLDTLHKLRHVDSIFIFCQNKNNYEQLKKDYHKIIGIFNEQMSLASSIKDAIELADRQSTIFALYNTDKQKSMRDLSRESGSFIFLQLVKHVIKQMAMNAGSTDESKQEMIAACRLYYRGNQKEMKNIDEFEKDYKSNQAIKWYTRDSFIYKLINKALRTEDIDALYTYRFYIADLCTCLANNCQILRDVTSNITVYRGIKMSKSERERIQESIGHHIAVNGFFSTSRQISVAKMYAGIGFQNPSSSASDLFESVLFVIDVDLDTYPDIILADIRHLSVFGDEDEVIFDLGTVFKIESFEYEDQNHYWICRMKASDEGRVIAQGYLDFKQTELNKSSDIQIVFGDLLHDMGEWLKSRTYFEQLAVRRINDPQVHLGIARTYDALNESDQALFHLKQAYDLAMEDNREWLALGAKICHYACRVHFFCNNFDDALAFNNETLELYRRAGENENRAGIAQALMDTGSIYFLKCEHDASLKHFQEALHLFQDVYLFDHPDKVTSLCYLSHCFYLRGEYEQALKYILEGTAIHERLLPKDHPQLSTDITCIGKLLYKQGKYDEALQRFRCATDSYERRMTDNNRTYALILNNIGKTLYRLNRLDEACTYYRKALQFIEKLFLTKSPDHADLAYTWKNIGEIHMAKCNATDALDLFERARDMYRRLFTNSDHRDIAKCWHLIGQTHVALGNNTEALEAFETALRMWTDKLPKHHPDIALCHQSMGDFYADKREEMHKAIEHFQIALSTYEILQNSNCKQIEMIRTKLVSLKNQQV
jgi:tetratricopeptide (TPR) repeat protein